MAKATEFSASEGFLGQSRDCESKVQGALECQVGEFGERTLFTDLGRLVS